MDEPTVGLDKSAIKFLKDCIIKESKDRIILLSTHDDFILGNENSVISILKNGIVRRVDKE